MSQFENQAQANRTLEGGLFYPTGHIVAAFPKEADAQKACEALSRQGFHDDAIVSISAESMAREARKNLDEAKPFLSLGATLPVRQKQLQLADEGCHFLLIEAEDDARQEQAMEALAAVPVRYAVKYNRLVIENLVKDLPSQTPDREAARVP